MTSKYLCFFSENKILTLSIKSKATLILVTFLNTACGKLIPLFKLLALNPKTNAPNVCPILYSKIDQYSIAKIPIRREIKTISNEMLKKSESSLKSSLINLLKGLVIIKSTTAKSRKKAKILLKFPAYIHITND